MRKIKYLMLFLIVLLFITFIPSVYADIGPKASLDIEVTHEDFLNLEIEFLILKSNSSEKREYDKYFPFSEELYNFLEDNEINGYRSAFINYYAPYGIKKEVGKNKTIFKATYRYPKSAKILIRNIDTNEIVITNIFNQKAFDALIKIDLTNVFTNNNYENITIIEHNDIKVREIHLLTKSFIMLFLRIVLTVVIEIGVLYLFKYRNPKSYLLVTITNIITQFLLSIFLLSTLYFSGLLMYIFYFIFGEIIVITFESLFYFFTLKEQERWKALLYGLAANIATIIIGILI